MSRTKAPNPYAHSRRLKPPAGLSDAATATFELVIANVDLDHFAPSDTPLLVEYCRAIDLANQADEQLARDGAVIDGKANAWLIVQEKAVRSMVALCARLRLAPQSRFDRLVAGRTGRPQPRWADDPDGLLAAPIDENPFDRNGRKPKTGPGSLRK